MSEQGADVLEIVALLQHFHAHAMADIVRLQHPMADQTPVQLFIR